MKRLVLALGIAGVLASGCSADEGESPVATPTESSTVAEPGLSDPAREGEGSGADSGQPPADDEQVAPRRGPVKLGQKAPCDATYSVEEVAAREFAFAGTIIAIEGDVVTFEPSEWFVGEQDLPATFSLGLAPTTTPGLSESAPAFGVGTQLLVSGAGASAWGCGFTRYFDAETADAWRTAP